MFSWAFLLPEEFRPLPISCDNRMAVTHFGHSSARDAHGHLHTGKIGL
jgi:hypothetical protein